MILFGLQINQVEIVPKISRTTGLFHHRGRSGGRISCASAVRQTRNPPSRLSPSSRSRANRARPRVPSFAIPSKGDREDGHSDISPSEKNAGGGEATSRATHKA